MVNPSSAVFQKENRNVTLKDCLSPTFSSLNPRIINKILMKSFHVFYYKIANNSLVSGDKYVVSLSVDCEVTHKEYFHVHVTRSGSLHELVKNSIIKHHESTINDPYLLPKYL